MFAVAGCSHDSSASSQPERAEPLALAIVFSGQSYWIGNDEYERREEDRLAGAFQNLRRAVDVSLEALPRGSEAALVEYSQVTRVKMPMIPVPPQASRLLGRQQDYHENIANDVPRGIRKAMDELARSELRRKRLVVIGDGSIMDYDRGPKELDELRQAAAAAGVETAAIVVPAALAVGDRIVIDRWTDRVLKADHAGQLPEQLRLLTTAR